MFTGLTSNIGEILDVTPTAENLRRVRIACHYDRMSLEIGASIACAGICVTIVGIGSEAGRTTISVDVAAESLAVSAASAWKPGTRINLERPLKYGDEIGGHYVCGHVDGTATVLEREDLTDMSQITFQLPLELSHFLARKDYVALDGVSLTVNEINDHTFRVLIVPHTLAVTTLGAVHKGDRLNLEVDMMTRKRPCQLRPE